MEEARARHDLRRDEVPLRACLAVLAVLVLVAVVLVFLPGQPPESRSWAQNSLSAIITGLVGYSFGQARKSP